MFLVVCLPQEEAVGPLRRADLEAHRTTYRGFKQSCGLGKVEYKWGSFLPISSIIDADGFGNSAQVSY